MQEEVRPRLEIPLVLRDYAVLLTGVVALVVMVVLPAYHYTELPQELPRHFAWDGSADAFSSKASIWALPVIGLLLCSGLFALSFFPHIFNYPVKITNENAAYQYRLSARMMRSISTFLAWSFAYMLWNIIQVSYGLSQGLSPFFIGLFVLGIIGAILVYLRRSKVKR